MPMLTTVVMRSPSPRQSSAYPLGERPHPIEHVMDSRYGVVDHTVAASSGPITCPRCPQRRVQNGPALGDVDRFTAEQCVTLGSTPAASATASSASSTSSVIRCFE